MRALILVALCISTAFAYDFNGLCPRCLTGFSSEYATAVRAKAPLVLLNSGPNAALRTKRDVRLQPLEDPEDCIKNCTSDLQDRLQDLNVTDSKEMKAIKLCRAMEPLDSCLKVCPESQFRSLMIDTLPLMKQPCLLGTENFS